MSKTTDSTTYPPEQYPFRIKNWDKFQHYRHRNPPWIKLHTALLTSPEWVMMSDASKLLAVILMLIASQYEGNLPSIINQRAYLKRVGGLTTNRPDIKPLIECGFLEKTLADASSALAGASKVLARVEESREDKKDAPPSAPPTEAAPTPASPEKELYQRGRTVLGKQAGGLIKKLLAAKGGDVALARAAIEVASTKADPREYVGAVVAKGGNGAAGWSDPFTFKGEYRV